MFGGVTHLNLDLKNRLAIPAKYRDLLHGENLSRLVVTLECAQSLLLYPEAEWAEVRAKVQQLPNSIHPLVKSYQRLVLGHAETVELDKSGRILLPAALKKMVHLEREVVLVGMGNRFELWDQGQWELETAQALQASATELATLLNGFSI
jgi:MraZ protein